MLSRKFPPRCSDRRNTGKLTTPGEDKASYIREWPGQVYREKRARALGSLRARLILLSCITKARVLN